MEERVSHAIAAFRAQLIPRNIGADWTKYLAYAIQDLNKITTLEHGKIGQAGILYFGAGGDNRLTAAAAFPEDPELDAGEAVAVCIAHVGKDVMFTLIFAGSKLADSPDIIILGRGGRGWSGDASGPDGRLGWSWGFGWEGRGRNTGRPGGHTGAEGRRWGKIGRREGESRKRGAGRRRVGQHPLKPTRRLNGQQPDQPAQDDHIDQDQKRDQHRPLLVADKCEFCSESIHDQGCGGERPCLRLFVILEQP